MADATFAGYSGDGYTHSAGGGLLGPNDFHGLAALLVTRTPLSEDETMAETARRRAALRRLMTPYGPGNPLVMQTLTCLERELSGAGALPTVHDIEGGFESSDAEDVEDGFDDRYEFRGAVQSAAPLAATGASAQATANPTIGDRLLRDEDDGFVKQTATATDPADSPDNAAHTVLFPRGAGGYAKTQYGCSRRHYEQKMLGSIAIPFRRSEEFLWYHFQQKLKRSLTHGAARVVSPHVALNVSGDDVDEHMQAIRKQWAHLQSEAPQFVPHCNLTESFAATVGKHVPGTKAYWWANTAHQLCAAHTHRGGPLRTSRRAGAMCSAANVHETLARWARVHVCC